jgi:hypothetical protein
MKTIQIDLSDIKKIVDKAEYFKSFDASLSNTIEITVIATNDSHLGSDEIDVWLKSNYAECIGQRVFNSDLNKLHNI